jgi:hypothetical protein
VRQKSRKAVGTADLKIFGLRVFLREDRLEVNLRNWESGSNLLKAMPARKTCFEVNTSNGVGHEGGVVYMAPAQPNDYLSERKPEVHAG